MSTHSNRLKAEFPLNAAMVHIEIDIRNRLWQELKTACEEAGWETTEGLPVILTIGLTALQGTDSYNHKKTADGDSQIDSKNQDVGKQDHVS